MLTQSKWVHKPNQGGRSTEQGAVRQLRATQALGPAGPPRACDATPRTFALPSSGRPPASRPLSPSHVGAGGAPEAAASASAGTSSIGAAEPTAVSAALKLVGRAWRAAEEECTVGSSAVRRAPATLAAARAGPGRGRGGRRARTPSAPSGRGAPLAPRRRGAPRAEPDDRTNVRQTSASSPSASSAPAA